MPDNNIEEKNKIEDNKGKNKLGECEKKAAEYLAGWQRERADFLNHKKEEMERMGGLINFAKGEWILKILPILDNFELAENNLTGNLKNDANVKGLLQIKKQLEEFMKNMGVEEIKTAGEKFDASLHEAVGEVEPFGAAQGQKSGVIFEEIQKGYKINGRLLRPAKVKITK